MNKKPKEKREIREQLEREKKEGKKARLLASLNVETSKQPRTQRDPNSIMQLNMKWCCKQADLDGKWSWGQERQWSEQDWNTIIQPNLEMFSGLTWADIFAQQTGTKERHNKHHEMEISEIITEAINRWEEIELDQYDTIFRFRLSGKKRLWGYRITHTFKLVWWDPTHQIYPTKKKSDAKKANKKKKANKR